MSADIFYLQSCMAQRLRWNAEAGAKPEDQTPRRQQQQPQEENYEADEQVDSYTYQLLQDFSKKFPNHISSLPPTIPSYRVDDKYSWKYFFCRKGSSQLGQRCLILATATWYGLRLADVIWYPEQESDFTQTGAAFKAENITQTGAAFKAEKQTDWKQTWEARFNLHAHLLLTALEFFKMLKVLLLYGEESRAAARKSVLIFAMIDNHTLDDWTGDAKKWLTEVIDETETHPADQRRQIDVISRFRSIFQAKLDLRSRSDLKRWWEIRQYTQLELIGVSQKLTSCLICTVVVCVPFSVSCLLHWKGMKSGSAKQGSGFFKEGGCLLLSHIISCLALSAIFFYCIRNCCAFNALVAHQVGVLREAALRLRLSTWDEDSGRAMIISKAVCRTPLDVFSLTNYDIASQKRFASQRRYSRAVVAGQEVEMEEYNKRDEMMQKQDYEEVNRQSQRLEYFASMMATTQSPVTIFGTPVTNTMVVSAMLAILVPLFSQIWNGVLKPCLQSIDEAVDQHLNNTSVPNVSNIVLIS
eukprot:TRINITY_DN9199_c0_g2_i1.p1 TRINITY_DN9199_c0_g2~~TRINITY_DN9199_c0_g2_i1.p1  ORF type:complete len:556 (+),score=66.61 TRINITY_DN9199_c0_g2_i1:88-1668(+)